MEYKINKTSNNYDWRLTGQDKYLMRVNLKFSEYKRFSDAWDHDHCDFCSAKFSEYEGDLHEGYRTLEDKCHWICGKCFNDFKDIFNWKVVE